LLVVDRARIESTSRPRSDNHTSVDSADLLAALLGDIVYDAFLTKGDHFTLIPGDTSRAPSTR
jgi:hypothetical protein